MTAQDTARNLTTELREHTLTWTVGSRLYGLASDDSDTDLAHVYLHVDDLIKPYPEYPEVLHYVSEDGLTEHKLYSLRKFCEMLVKGDTNSVELCFHPHDFVYERSFYQTRINHLLTIVRPWVITQNCLARYYGHLSSIMHEMTRAEADPGKFSLPTPKRMSHAFRLAITLQRILETGEMFKIPESTHELAFVRQVKFEPTTHMTFRLARELHARLGIMVTDGRDKFSDGSELRTAINQEFLSIAEDYFQCIYC